MSLLLALAVMQAQPSIEGRWRSPGGNSIIDIAPCGSDHCGTVAWASDKAKEDAKKRVQREVEKTPREVGFFQAITDLKLAGFDKQIEEGMKWDNSELINAAKAAKEAVASLGSGGKKVAELPPAEVAKTAMESKGDAAAGERIFSSQGCIACHSVDPKAEQKGPYLGASGAKFTRDYLIESILDPNKVVAQGFQTSMFKMKDGVAHMGFVTGEADGVVELRNIAGQVTKLKRVDVAEENHMPQSMMPPGLAAGLSVQDFTSLIEYLSTLKATGG